MSNNSRVNILMIYTGGTIGMKENPTSHSLEPLDFNHLLESVPKINKLDFEVDHFQFETPLDSSAINPSHWKLMSEVIRDNYDKYDGFVILHGTDTMAYTASALSYMLNNLTKPVIITGSQLPIGEVRTDGEENLITALQVAATKDASGNPMVQEVAILFNNYLWRGNRSTKHSSDNFNAFQSNNYPALAHMGLGISFNQEALMRNRSGEPFYVKNNVDTNVIYMDLFPGICKAAVTHLLSTPGLKGVVMKTFGSGNGPTDEWFIEAIKDAVERGIVVVNVTQCPIGSVLPMRYVTGLRLTQAGVVPGHDLTSEAAITKLMYLFGQNYSSDEVKRLMETSLCGEITL